MLQRSSKAFFEMGGGADIPPETPVLVRGEAWDQRNLRWIDADYSYHGLTTPQDPEITAALDYISLDVQPNNTITKAGELQDAETRRLSLEAMRSMVGPIVRFSVERL
jgi:hypothetical protein